MQTNVSAAVLSLHRVSLGEFISGSEEKKKKDIIVSVSAVFSFVAFEPSLETNNFLLYFPLETVRRSAFRWSNEKQAPIDNL